VTNLAGFLITKGEPARAEPFCRRVLEIRERTLGPDHRDTLMSRASLAGLLRDRRQFPEAETLFRQNLQAQERLLGPDHQQTCIAAGSLAEVLMKADKIPEATELAWRAYRGMLKAKDTPPALLRKTRNFLLEMGETVLD
jgi:hypothetical protein